MIEPEKPIRCNKEPHRRKYNCAGEAIKDIWFNSVQLGRRFDQNKDSISTLPEITIDGNDES
jgi:hypothetical protein